MNVVTLLERITDMPDVAWVVSTPSAGLSDVADRDVDIVVCRDDQSLEPLRSGLATSTFLVLVPDDRGSGVAAALRRGADVCVVEADVELAEYVTTIARHRALLVRRSPRRASPIPT